MLEESKLLVAEGVEAARARRRLRAGALFTDALTLDPENEEAWLWLARMAVKVDDRRAYLQEVSRLNPANEEARQALRAMDHPQGEAGLRRLINRARAHQKSGARRQALAAWKAALEIDPGNEQAVRGVIELLGGGRKPRSRALLQSALRQNPHSAVLKLLYAESLAELNRWDEVMSVLDQIDRRGLRTADAFERVGRLYLSAGRLPAASDAFERAVALPGHNPLLYYQLGRLFERADQTERAVEAYRHVVDQAWGTPEAGEAERRLRELSPYLPPSIADSWPFILREAAGWAILVFLMAVLDSGVRIVGLSAAGLLATLLSLVGGVCWAVGGVSTGTLNLFGPRAPRGRARHALRAVASALFVAAVMLSLGNSLGSAAEFILARFS